MSPLQVRRAFTLVELLVVIAIIGVLVALLLPAVQAAREASRKSQCKNNLKQIGLAVQMHHDTRKQFPTGRTSQVQQGASWAFLLLPYMEQKAIYDAYDASVPVFDDLNALAMRSPVATYFCPSRRSPSADRDFDNNNATPLVTAAAAGGDYAANAGVHYRYGSTDEPLKFEDPGLVAGPIFSFSRIKGRMVEDGLSNTLAVGERHIPVDLEVAAEKEDQKSGDTAFFAGDSPETIFGGTEKGLATGYEDKSDDKFGSEHGDIVHFTFLDGHVSGLNADIDQTTLHHLSAISDGQVIDISEL